MTILPDSECEQYVEMIDEQEADMAEAVLREEDIGEEIEADEDGEGYEPIIVDVTEDGAEDDKDGVLDSADRGAPFLAELNLHEGEPAYSLALHPSGKLVASAGGNDHASIFEVTMVSKGSPDGGLQINPLIDLSGHQDTVEHVQFNADGSLLATGSLDGTLRVYAEEGNSWKLKHVLEGPTEVTWIDWHPKGPVLAAGSMDGAVWMWEAKKGICMQVFAGTATSSAVGRFSPDGRTLISAGEGVITMWNPKTGATLLCYSGNLVPTSMAISLACHSSKSIAAVGFANGVVLVVHCENHQILATIPLTSTSMDREEDEEMQEGEACSVEQVAFVTGQPILLAADFRGMLHTFDSNSWKLRSIRSHSAGITSARLLADASTVAIGCLDGSISLWDVRNGESLAQHRPEPREDEEEVHDNAVYDILELPHSNLLLASFDDGKIRIFSR